MLKYPRDGKVSIKSLAKKDAAKLPNFHGIIKDITVLGFNEKPQWIRDEEALKIETQTIDCDKPVGFKILVD